MKLEQVEADLGEAIRDELARGIDKDPGDFARRNDRVANFARAFERDASRTGRVEIHAYHVGAELDRGTRVFNSHYTANFYAHTHFTPSKAARSSGSFAAG